MTLSNEEYDDFIRDYYYLDNKASEHSSALDKYLLTMNAGAIGLSVTFLGLVPIKSPWVTCALPFSWVLFVVSVVSVFFSIELARKAFNRECRARHDEYIIDDNEEKKKLENINELARQKTVNRIGWYNKVAFWSSIAGVALFLVVAWNCIVDMGGESAKRIEDATESQCCFCGEERWRTKDRKQKGKAEDFESPTEEASASPEKEGRGEVTLSGDIGEMPPSMRKAEHARKDTGGAMGGSKMETELKTPSQKKAITDGKGPAKAPPPRPKPGK